MRYINIHTHRQAASTEWAIQNKHQHFEQVLQPGIYSAGLHPWYIDDNHEQELALLKQFSTHTHVKAIGECGLDKVCTTDFTLQQAVFEQHILLAKAINKPLLIHSVKAYDEVLQAIRNKSVKAVFHGFNKSKELALQLVNEGHYLSFGKALLQPHIQEVLKVVPMNRIFLETDDAAMSIQELYQLASGIFLIDELLFSLQLQQNVLTVFNC